MSRPASLLLSRPIQQLTPHSSTSDSADDQLATDLPLLLPPSSPRSAQVRRVITRLLSALDEMNDRSSSIVSFAGSGLTSTPDGGYAERIAAALKDATDRETAVLRMGESAWMLEGKGWDGHSASLKDKLNKKSGRELSDEEEANVISIDGWKLYVVDLVRPKHYPNSHLAL